MKGIKENENKSVEGRDINLESGRVGFETRPTSSLCRKGRGSHPVIGSGLKQRDEQRERMQFRRRIKTLVNNHLLDPNIFLGGR